MVRGGEASTKPRELFEVIALNIQQKQMYQIFYNSESRSVGKTPRTPFLGLKIYVHLRSESTYPTLQIFSVRNEIELKETT